MHKHNLIFGDALRVLPTMGGMVDAVITDPPYNTAHKNTKVLKGRKALSADFGAWDYFGEQEYKAFTAAWISNVKRLLKPNGNLLTFSKLEHISDIKSIYEKLGFKHHGTIIWHKTNPAPKIRKTGFLSSCEAILWATNGYDDAQISYTFNFSKQNEMHNFIETPICMGLERTAHPTQKPKRLISRLLEIFTKQGDCVLDCFAGSGTVAAAADALCRNTVNVENDAAYFSLMRARLQDTVGKVSVKRSGYARAISRKLLSPQLIS